MSDERDPGEEQIQPASDDARWRVTPRLAFQILGAIAMGVLLIVFVIQPAVARGGFGELFIIAGIFAGILLLEWWLRNR